jgi:hypothetical protein
MEKRLGWKTKAFYFLVQQYAILKQENVCSLGGGVK